MNGERMTQQNNSENRAHGPEKTREQLIGSGLRLFGQYGFEGTTTRALARDAGVNQAAIPYHFGGKEGLYRAVVEWVVETILGEDRAHVSQFPARLAEANGNPVRQAAVVRSMISFLAGNILGSESLRERAAFIMREYAEAGIGFDIIYERLVREVHVMITHMVAVISGLPEESDEAKLRAHTLVGMVIGFAMGRPVVFARMPWDGYTPERVRDVVRVVSDMALSALGLPAGEGTCCRG
ncbi:DUF1956 domain-containing protein [Pseudodesulfovibrio senegalensis]|uniref:DUF1956 domain-containing protein n=2 Tax=Pseudodesulfovibrio senegalensis TaxID=1721087 RepID=A0A6N6MZ98_9BACT|nr:DUF1956 domain-containing protein [Pseudodesulfovibrio senegalensis]